MATVNWTDNYWETVKIVDSFHSQFSNFVFLGGNAMYSSQADFETALHKAPENSTLTNPHGKTFMKKGNLWYILLKDGTVGGDGYKPFVFPSKYWVLTTADSEKENIRDLMDDAAQGSTVFSKEMDRRYVKLGRKWYRVHSDDYWGNYGFSADVFDDSYVLEQ